MTAPDPGRRERDVDVLIVGAGPAGLAAATELARGGAGRVEVLDRERQAGGTPRHSHHTGYGVRDLRRVMNGPAYARHHLRTATHAGATVRTALTATGWAGPLTLDTTGPDGLERITARAVVLATGARERPRSARLIPGDRPSGVFTTGRLQRAVHLRQPIGSRAVIVGAEHVSYSAAVTLHHAGVRVAAMVTDLPHPQSYKVFRLAAALRYRFPVLTGVTVTRLVGGRGLDGVEIRRDDGTTGTIACDTVVFTGDWIPDHELTRHGGLTIDPGTRGPAVDTALGTSAPGVFAAGNLLHPVETADVAAIDGRHVARCVLAHLAGRGRVDGTVPMHVTPPLRWVAPNRVGPGGPGPPRDRFILWTSAFAHRPHISVVQGGRLLYERRLRPGLVPGRPGHLPATWMNRVDPHGEAIRIDLRC